MHSTEKPACGFYKQYLLLYVDFLGAKRRILHDDDSLYPCILSLKSALSTISSYQQYRDRDDPNAERPYIKVFFDNIAAVEYYVPYDTPIPLTMTQQVR